MKVFALKSKKEKVRIRIVPKEQISISIREPFRIKGAFLSIFVGLIFSGLFSYGIYVFAIPPSSPYAPGATLNPSCAPGSANCTVSPPLYISGSTLDLGTAGITSGNPLQIKYNSSNYATLSVGSSGDLSISATSSGSGGKVNFNSSSSSNATILSSSGILNLGGAIAGDESLNFDFHDYTNKVVVTSDTGVSSIDFGSINLSTTGILTLGGSTTGTLVTRVATGAPTESDTNGSLVVDSVSGRLYFRYSNAWHYVAQTGGFQIPNFETVDPISGEEIQEGDFVVGMIDKSLEDNALHGVWVRWDTIKAQLAEEIALTGGLSVSPTSTVSDETTQITTEPKDNKKDDSLLGKVKNVLSIIGIVVKDGVTKIANLAVENLTAKTAKIEKLELKDSVTGDYYCTWIENGEWKKVKGECGSIEVASGQSQEIVPPPAPAPEPTPEPEPAPAPEPTPEPEPAPPTPAPAESSVDSPGNSENSQGKSDKAKGNSNNGNSSEQTSSTQIDALIQDSTSALFDRMNVLIKSATSNIKYPSLNVSEFSAGFMEPLKNLIETLFVEPAGKILKSIDSVSLPQYTMADFHKASSEKINNFLPIILEKAQKDLEVAVGVSDFSQDNFIQSALRFTRSTENTLLNFREIRNQIASGAWLFNPSGLIQESSSNTYKTALVINEFSILVVEELSKDLVTYIEFSKFSQNNLVNSVINISSQSFESLQIFNPAGLVQEFSVSVYKVNQATNNTIISLGEKISKDVLTDAAVSKFAQNNLIKSSLAFNYKAQNMLMGSSDSLGKATESFWILNPYGLIQEASANTYRLAQMTNRFSIAVVEKASKDLVTYAGISRFMQNNLAESSLALNYQTQNILMGSLASFNKSAESLWLVNPVTLIIEMKNDFSKNLSNLSNLAISNQYSAEEKVKNISGIIFLEIQNSEIAIFNDIDLLTALSQKSSAGLLNASMARQFKMEGMVIYIHETAQNNVKQYILVMKDYFGGAGDYLNSLWVFNPASLLEAGKGELRNNVKRLLEAHPLY